MTLLEPALTSSRPPAPRAVRRSGGRIATVFILVVSLVCAAILREVAADRQDANSQGRGVNSTRSTLGNMDSFALALLLGGLRGPLVMFLWSTSETQKSDRNLEDFDTKVEWIRLLQPEFDTVHMFQIWNKAYNISAMMASPANKYTVIMEALKYADDVDHERPGDVNILNSIANVYGGKLGSVTLPEFGFYSRQLREESLTDANRARAFPEETSRFSRLDKNEPLLDDHNDIRPNLLAPVEPRPGKLADDAEWNDGSALQYLKDYQPFPYGISPLAMSFNYSKRAEVAISAEGQKPLQLSAMVVDSRPAIQGKLWSEDEMHRARNSEAVAFGIPITQNGDDVYRRMSHIPFSQKCADRAALGAAIYFYDSAHHVTIETLKEFRRHLKKPDYIMRGDIYKSHISDLHSAEPMSQADHDFLLAMVTADAAQRSTLLHNAVEQYYKAMLGFERTALVFYTEDDALKAQGPGINGGSVMPRKYLNTDTVPGSTGQTQHFDKRDVEKLMDSEISGVYDNAMIVASHLAGAYQSHRDERADYQRSVDRCRLRIDAIRDELKK